MHIAFFQYGNYGEAVRRFEAGEGESYYAQRYSVDFVARMTEEFGEVTVVCLNSDAYDAMLPNGVRALGMRLWSPGGARGLRETAAQLNPTHAVIAAPLTWFLRWTRRRGTRCLPLFADSFPHGGLRQRWRDRQLARTLNRPDFDWVGNHNVNSSRDLARIGVDPSKIIPWDWPSPFTPDDYPVKTAPEAANPLRLLYVGHLSRAKGLQECIEAVGQLAGSPEEARLTVLAGRGPDDEFAAIIKRAGAEDKVRFVEKRAPHREVVAMMHDHDAMIVPSRHEYPEGLPMTVYDAFCSRTPLVASDHPMFAGKIIHEQNALVFKAGDAQSLAETLRRLRNEPELYARLSQHSKQAWATLQCPVKWGDLIACWLRDSEEDRTFLARHSLGAGDYAQ